MLANTTAPPVWVDLPQRRVEDDKLVFLTATSSRAGCASTARKIQPCPKETLSSMHDARDAEDKRLLEAGEHTQLLENYVYLVQEWVSLRVRDRQAAEEVVQRVFLRLARELAAGGHLFSRWRLQRVTALQRANPSPTGSAPALPEVTRAIGRASVVILSSHFERYLYAVNEEACTVVERAGIAASFGSRLPTLWTSATESRTAMHSYRRRRQTFAPMYVPCALSVLALIGHSHADSRRCSEQPDLGKQTGLRTNSHSCQQRVSGIRPNESSDG